eukprot:12274172-Karenia_brevis.AAC.1
MSMATVVAQALWDSIHAGINSSIHHIKSHTGNPINEFADSFANSLPWLFVQYLSDSSAYHQSFKQGNLLTNDFTAPRWQAISADVIAGSIDAVPKPVCVDNSTYTYPLSVVTFNTGRLRSHAYMSALATQMSNDSIDVAGLQETGSRIPHQ